MKVVRQVLLIFSIATWLAACGGGGGGGAAAPTGGSYTVGGSVSGMTGTGLVLRNNGGDDLSVTANGPFIFATPVADGAGYLVTIKSQPAGQTCSAGNGAGTISGVAITAVNVTCVAKQPSFANFQSASAVIGQPTFTSNDTNQSGSAGPKTLYQPGGTPAVINGALYLPDAQNNRVLGFNSVPVANDPSADFVLGQPNLSSSSFATTAATMNVPLGIVSSNGKLFAADAGNDRVLIWNTVPTTTQAAPNVVLGHTDFLTAVSSCTRPD